jgi:GTP-binding protein
MSLVDECNFYATAGRGGDGVVRWRREKFRPKGGPSGGDGGKGGDFYIKGIRDILALRDIARKDSYSAEDGKPGEKNSRHGANGEDFVLELPIGSVVTNMDTGDVVELVSEGEKIRLLKGGEGGLGNEHFKSSTNQKPMHATKGEDPESANFHVELKLVADVGLVGFPNVGKTSLLNALTNAGARVADYPFTTLDPNLGVYHKYILADIPGIIEGASQGKGLGHKFLRHISRTSVILHCISLERDNIKEDYEIIRKELASYEGLAKKDEYIVLTKSDTVSDDKLDQAKKTVKDDLKKELLGIITILDDNAIKEFADNLIKIIRNK